MSGAVVYVKDIARVRAFYESVAELTVDREARDHTVLRSSTARLVLVRVPDAIAATIEITDPPARRAENPVKLILPVTSIAAARERAAHFGGEVGAVEREWDFDEVRVCDGVDPEGNVVQFHQCAGR